MNENAKLRARRPRSAASSSPGRLAEPCGLLRELPMPREQKIVATLLILAVGLGSAFCLRKRNPDQPPLPGLPGERRINERVAELRTRPLLPGIDLREATPPRNDAEEALSRELAGLLPRNARQQGSGSAPPPIGTIREQGSEGSVPMPLDPPPGSEKNPFSQWENQQTGSRPSARPITRPESRPALPREPEVHIVQPGETLTGISLQHFGTVSRYLDIFEANRDLLPSPNHLRPNMRLKLPEKSTPVEDARHSQIREARQAEGAESPPRGAASPQEKSSSGPKPTGRGNPFEEYERSRESGPAPRPATSAEWGSRSEEGPPAPIAESDSPGKKFVAPKRYW